MNGECEARRAHTQKVFRLYQVAGYIAIENSEKHLVTPIDSTYLS